MLNQVIVIGKLQKIVDNGDSAIISIANTRAFKNANGEYETDIIDFKVWEGIKNNIIDYCKQGDTIGVKARVITEEKDGKRIMVLLADKITFLTTKAPETNGETNNE